MSDSRSILRSGFVALGSAGLVSRILDVGALVVVLRYVPKEAIGEASIAWTITLLFEAWNGLGLNWAMLRARTLTRRQLDTIFWVSTLSAIGFALLLVGLAFGIGWFSDRPEIVPLISVAGLKLVAMGVAVVPYQRLTRALRYAEVAGAQVAASLLAALTRIGLAIAGAGAWAFVASHVLQGVYLTVAILAIAPFRPRRVLDLGSLRGLWGFGLRSSATTTVQQLYRNVDYLLVGSFLGLGELGLYRIAFDLAMEPMVAIADVVTRTATPLFCRLAPDQEALRSAFRDTVRSFGLVAAPLLLATALTAPDVLVLLRDPSYLAATTTARLLVLAAGLRGLQQLFPPVFQASGRADLSLRLSIELAVGLAIAIAGSLALFGDRFGTTAVALAWVIAHPLVTLHSLALARSVAKLTAADLFAGLREPLVAGSCAALAGLSVGAVGGSFPPAVRVVTQAAAIALVAFGCTRYLSSART